MEFDLAEYQKLRQRVESEYDKMGSVYCPALKSMIKFNADGKHHLRYDQYRAERSKKSQYTKFIYFPQAVDIIKKATTIQEYRRGFLKVGKSDKSGFRKTSLIEWFAFWGIISFKKGIRIRTVVRRVGGNEGFYHFWSVMPFWNLSSGHRVIGSREIEDE